MKKLEYQVSFTTPAFLGNAEQNGQWRTPPFKALLRQWWRVAYAAEKRFQVDVAAMRREEGQLFGSAADGSGNRSLVRIRLSGWEIGSMKKWEGEESVSHHEVGQGGSNIGAHLYLGYGPLNFNSGTFLGKREGRDFKPRAAIQAEEEGALGLACPDDRAELIDSALWLMDRYGTIGGRSRNGWGSFSLTPLAGTPALGGKVPLRPWRDALGLDWPHAIGQDDGGALEWQTELCDDWKSLMRRLAEIKIGMRTQFSFALNAAANDRQTQRGINHGRPQERHWLSYPVTNHPVSPWGNNARLPNTLRFKVRPTPDGKLFGVVFHVPCRPPRDFQPDEKAINRVWQQVHRHLDQAGLKRIPA